MKSFVNITYSRDDLRLEKNMPRNDTGRTLCLFCLRLLSCWRGRQPDLRGGSGERSASEGGGRGQGVVGRETPDRAGLCASVRGGR